MKFEYQLTRKDLSNYSTYYYWKNRTSGAIVGAVCVAVVACLFFSNQKKLNISAAVVCTAISIILYFVLLQLQLKKYGELFKENGPMLAKKEVELSEEYYISTDVFGVAKIKWNAFSKIETGKHAIYLFMENPLAIIIPKATFADETQTAEFISYVNDRLRSSIFSGL